MQTLPQNTVGNLLSREHDIICAQARNICQVPNNELCCGGDVADRMTPQPRPTPTSSSVRIASGE